MYNQKFNEILEWAQFGKQIRPGQSTGGGEAEDCV